MVSTRGYKIKFYEGERVLCYEPDLTKAKVLYDSKVLDVVFVRDDRNKKSVEYLIHFQGWNSSWDRYVAEDYVLKDTPENRQLQKDLAEKSQLQFGAYLYRKERKKNRKPSDRAAASSEDGSSGSPARMDTDDGQDSTTSDDDSSVEDESVHIDITQNLRDILETDYYLINTKDKLLKLPAEPNVATILESYYRHYATNQICGLNEKPNPRYRLSVNKENKLKPEDIQKNLTLCREVMDGLRIYFDFSLNDLLLYKHEQGQIQTKIATTSNETSNGIIKTKPEEEYTNHHHPSIEEGNQNGNDSARIMRKRSLRSNRNESHTNGNVAPHEAPPVNINVVKPGSSTGSSNSDISGPLAKNLSWQLLPDHVHSQQPPPPCLVYGATHLTRLLVKLPEMLTDSTIPENKMKVLLSYIDLFIDFLNEHKDWYGEKYYIDKV